MRKQTFLSRLTLLSLALIGILAFASGTVFSQATIIIVNDDFPGEGFNDTTPAVPVGGNAGTTLGQQRMIAFQHAANIWGGKLDSNVVIRVQAFFSTFFTCGGLAAARANFIFADFPSLAPFPGPLAPNTWHPMALANKRAGFELLPGELDMLVAVNGDLNGCGGDQKFYLGLDNNHGRDFDLVGVLLHEFAHGLGFSHLGTNTTTGAQPLNMTNVYSRQLLDTTTGKTWDMMTDAERAASAINSRKVVWNGANVNAQVPNVLTPGAPLLKVNSPAAIAGNYAAGAAVFGPALSSPGITGDMVRALDPADVAGPTTFDACSPLTNAAAIAGNIALVDRGTCFFIVKVKNAQDAGAIAVIVADNQPSSQPMPLFGADPTITIPSVRVTLADGNTIKAELAGGVNATLGIDLSVIAGADANGRALMYAPNPVEGGSSISHWDPIAFRNQLMEPFINADLTHSVSPLEDLTLPLLRDIGWFRDTNLDGIPDGDFDFDDIPDAVDCSPNSDRRPTVIIDGCDTGVPNTLFTSGPIAGCTISDLIKRCAAKAGNHGNFVSCVAHLTNDLKKAGVITGSQKGEIMNCAAGSSLP